MEYSIQTLNAVVNQLKSLFTEKSELKGFDDWDAFVGCIIAIEQVIQELQSQEIFGKDETPNTEE